MRLGQEKYLILGGLCSIGVYLVKEIKSKEVGVELTIMDKIRAEMCVEYEILKDYIDEIKIIQVKQKIK